jgi:hypothetical protein
MNKHKKKAFKPSIGMPLKFLRIVIQVANTPANRRDIVKALTGIKKSISGAELHGVVKFENVTLEHFERAQD